MIASVYIKDNHIHIYNKQDSFSDIGGLVYELGRPLLNFVCYEQNHFDDDFSIMTEAFDNELAHWAAKAPNFIAGIKQLMSEFQQEEVYLYFYRQMLMEFIFVFIESPKQAIMQLEEKISGAREKLSWAMDFEWSISLYSFAETPIADEEKRLFRAAKDVVALMRDDLKSAQSTMIQEIEWLINLRAEEDVTITSPMDYLYMIEVYHLELYGRYVYLDNPFRAFYGVITAPEIVELYEIDSIADLLRFEFVKMIERDIFIKKCKNCERFFIPKRRADVEYCDYIYGDSNRTCSEVGATIRYEKKVAGNPILEAHKKAYRRLHSHTRTKKMTQSDFLKWSEEASRKRDACLAGTLGFEEFVEWLELGRMRKGRNDYAGIRKDGGVT